MSTNLVDIRKIWAFMAIRVLAENGVFSLKEAQEEIEELIQYGGSDVFAMIGCTEYRITGIADVKDILEIKDELTGESINMETIKEFEEWVKTLFADQ